MTNDEINELVKLAKYGPDDVTLPALDNEGQPIQVGKLSDGRPILVAANRDGSPMKDPNGEFVVIDPQTGLLRHKLKLQGHQRAVPVNTPDQANLAVAQLAQHDPGFLAFARAVHVVKKLKKTARDKVWAFFLPVLAFTAWLSEKMLRSVLWARKQVLKVVDFISPPPSHINIASLKGVEKYLNTSALNLLNTKIDKTIFKSSSNKLAVAQYAMMRVPLEPDGSVSEEYVRRWAAFLNSMADRGIWKYGTLAPPSLISLALVEMRWEACLFTFIFSEETDIKKLNEAVGYPVFQIEGSIGDRSDWSTFPW